MRCRNGLHEKPYPGRCGPCERAWRARYRVKQTAAQARYEKTAKGKATNRRYATSKKGRAAKRDWAFLNPN